MAERLNSVWAKDAVTNIPDVPVTGTAYRDEQYKDNYNEGQQYDAIYNSARYNEFFYQVSSLLKELCEQGLLQFVENQHYQSRAVVFYSNSVFIALRDIPADEVPYPIPGSSTAWLKLVWQAGKGLTTDYTNEQIQFNAGAGLSIDENNDVNVNVGYGMTIQDDTIMPLVGQGIGLDENGKIIPMLGKGLEFSADGKITVIGAYNAGDGIEIDNDTSTIKVKAGTGLSIAGDGSVTVQTGAGCETSTEGNLNVLVGQGLKVNTNNAIQADLGNGVEFSNNLIQIKKNSSGTNGVIIDGNGILVDTIPIGTIIMLAHNNTPSNRGWLYCNGAAVSRTTYAQLFAVIGTLWGAGDGSTTFNLPNGSRSEGDTDRVIGCGMSGVAYSNAGLPNATGMARIYSDFNWHNYDSVNIYTGICKWTVANENDPTKIHGTNQNLGSGQYDAVRNIPLSLQNGNSMYGRTNTVRCNTLWLKPWIKASY